MFQSSGLSSKELGPVGQSGEDEKAQEVGVKPKVLTNAEVYTMIRFGELTMRNAHSGRRALDRSTWGAACLCCDLCIHYHLFPIFDLRLNVIGIQCFHQLDAAVDSDAFARFYGFLT